MNQMRQGLITIIIICLVVIGVVIFIDNYVGDRTEEITKRIAQHISGQSERHRKALYENLHYFRDPRTGLCFTGWTRGGSLRNLARVPCEVLDKLEESK